MNGEMIMDEWINYDQFDRQTWHSFFPSEITFLTQENLDEIKSLNDQISLRDVQDIYLPLIKLIQLQYQNYQQMQLQKMQVLAPDSVHHRDRRFGSGWQEHHGPAASDLAQALNARPADRNDHHRRFFVPQR